MEKQNENDVLLKVENLCQYFKMGPAMELKAVDNVSFEIRKKFSDSSAKADAERRLRDAR